MLYNYNLSKLLAKLSISLANSPIIHQISARKVVDFTVIQVMVANRSRTRSAKLATLTHVPIVKLILIHGLFMVDAMIECDHILVNILH